MDKNDTVQIHLPDGNTYELILSTDGKEVATITDKEITQLRLTISGADDVEVTVKPTFPQQKSKKIILWGDVLKNSYITVTRY